MTACEKGCFENMLSNPDVTTSSVGVDVARISIIEPDIGPIYFFLASMLRGLSTILPDRARTDAVREP